MASEVCDELPTAKWNIILITILGLFISVIACTTNALILIAIYRKPSLHSVTNYFLAALAFGDFFVGIVAQPMWVVRSLLQVADEEHPLSIGVDCVYVLSVAISTYNLCATNCMKMSMTPSKHRLYLRTAGWRKRAKWYIF